MEHSEDKSDQVAQSLRALRNDDRRAILLTLLAEEMDGDGELPVEVIAQRVGLKRDAASKHLSLMREAGIIESRRFGAKRLQKLRRDPLVMLFDWLLPFIEVDESADQRPTAMELSSRLPC